MRVVQHQLQCRRPVDGIEQPQADGALTRDARFGEPAPQRQQRRQAELRGRRGRARARELGAVGQAEVAKSAVAVDRGQGVVDPHRPPRRLETRQQHGLGFCLAPRREQRVPVLAQEHGIAARPRRRAGLEDRQRRLGLPQLPPGHQEHGLNGRVHLPDGGREHAERVRPAALRAVRGAEVAREPRLARRQPHGGLERPGARGEPALPAQSQTTPVAGVGGRRRATARFIGGAW